MQWIAWGLFNRLDDDVVFLNTYRRSTTMNRIYLEIRFAKNQHGQRLTSYAPYVFSMGCFFMYKKDRHQNLPPSIFHSDPIFGIVTLIFLSYRTPLHSISIKWITAKKSVQLVPSKTQLMAITPAYLGVLSLPLFSEYAPWPK